MGNPIDAVGNHPIVTLSLGAVAGFLVGGPVGAVIGGAALAGVSFAIQKFAPSDDGSGVDLDSYAASQDDQGLYDGGDGGFPASYYQGGGSVLDQSPDQAPDGGSDSTDDGSGGDGGGDGGGGGYSGGGGSSGGGSSGGGGDSGGGGPSPSTTAGSPAGTGPTATPGGAPVPGTTTALNPSTVGAGGPTLPTGVNTMAAQNAAHLFALGGANEAKSAAYWLQQFQASAGVPATGQMDPTTRALLDQATAGSAYDSSRMPANLGANMTGGGSIFSKIAAAVAPKPAGPGVGQAPPAGHAIGFVHAAAPAPSAAPGAPTLNIPKIMHVGPRTAPQPTIRHITHVGPRGKPVAPPPPPPPRRK